jgi:hypothetical protein
LNDDKMLERDHLTALPAMDMEHFMYRQGFDDVYHRVAQLPMNMPMNMRRVITKAIHRSSKPDLAIEVAMEAGRAGLTPFRAVEKNVLPRAMAGARARGLAPTAVYLSAGNLPARLHPQPSTSVKQKLSAAKNARYSIAAFR